MLQLPATNDFLLIDQLFISTVKRVISEELPEDKRRFSTLVLIGLAVVSQLNSAEVDANLLKEQSYACETSLQFFWVFKFIVIVSPLMSDRLLRSLQVSSNVPDIFKIYLSTIEVISSFKEAMRPLSYTLLDYMFDSSSAAFPLKFTSLKSKAKSKSLFNSILALLASFVAFPEQL